MVLSNYVASLLTAYLGSFLKDINKDSVNVSILRGYVELRNVELSPAITEDNDFFRLQRGVIGYLKVDIPWHSLNRKSCGITIRDVSILLSTHKHSAQETGDTQRQKKKMDQLDIDNASSLSPAEDGKGTDAKSHEGSSAHTDSGAEANTGGGYFERLQQNIIANFSFLIENVVVRIEETTGCYEGEAAAAALSFQRIICEPTDENYQPHFVTASPGSNVYRRIRYEALTVMLFNRNATDTAAPPLVPLTGAAASATQFAEYCRSRERSTPFLSPCDAQTCVMQSGGSKSGSRLRFQVQYFSTLHETRISECNVRAIRALLYGIIGGQQRRLLQERPHVRPSRSVAGSAGAWWTYVLHEVRAQVKHRRRKAAFDWTAYLQRKRQCNEYFNLCAQKLANPAAVSLERQRELEDALPLSDLLACRRIARVEAKKTSIDRLIELPRDFRESSVQQPSRSVTVDAHPPALKSLGFDLAVTVHWNALRATVDGGLVAEMDGFHAAASMVSGQEPSLFIAPRRVSLGLGAYKRLFSLTGRARTDECISVLHSVNMDGGSRTIISTTELGIQVNADALGATVSLLSAYKPLIDSMLLSAPRARVATPSSGSTSPKQETTDDAATDAVATARCETKTRPARVFDIGLQQVTVTVHEICVIARNLHTSIVGSSPPTHSIEDFIVTVRGSALAYANSLELTPGGRNQSDAIAFIQGNVRVEDNLEAVEYIKDTLRSVKKRVLEALPASAAATTTGGEEAETHSEEKAPFSVEVLFPRISFLDLELRMLRIDATLGDGWRIHMTSFGLTTSAGCCPEAELELVLWADGFVDTSPYAGGITEDGIAFHFDVNNAQLTLDDKLCMTAERLLDLVMLAIFQEEDSRVYLRSSDDARKVPCLGGSVSLSYSTLRLCPCQSAVPTGSPLRRLRFVAQDNEDVYVSVKRFRDKEMFVDVKLGDGLSCVLEDTVVPLDLFPLRRGSTTTVMFHVMPPTLEDIPVFPYSRCVLDVAAADKAVVLHLPTIIALWDHFNTSGAGLWRLRNIGSRVHFSSRASRGRALPPRSPRSTAVADIGLTARLTAEAPPNTDVPAFPGPYSSPVLPGDLAMSVRFSACELYYMWGDGRVSPLFLHINVAWCHIDISNHDCCTRVELSGVASLPRIACSTSVSADGTDNEALNDETHPVGAVPDRPPQTNLDRRRATLAAEREDDTHALVKLIYTNDARPPFNAGVADESMHVSLTGCRPHGDGAFVGTPSLNMVMTPAELAAWCTLLTFYGKEETKKAEGQPTTPPPPPGPPAATAVKSRQFLLDVRFAPAELHIPSLGTSVVLWCGARFSTSPGCAEFVLPRLSLIVHHSLQAERERVSEWCGCMPALQQLAEEGYAIVELTSQPSSSSLSRWEAPSATTADRPGLVWRGGLFAVHDDGDDDDTDEGTGPGRALIIRNIHVQLSEAVLVEVQNTQVLARLSEVSEARVEQETWLMDAIHCRRHALLLAREGGSDDRDDVPRSASPVFPSAARFAPTAEEEAAPDPALRILVRRAVLSVHWLSYCCERAMAVLTCALSDVSYSSVDSLQIGAGRVEIAPQKTQAGRQRRRRYGAPRASPSLAYHRSLSASSGTATAPSSPVPSKLVGEMVPRVVLPRLNVRSTRRVSSASTTSPTLAAAAVEGGDGVVLVVAPVLLLLTTSTCTLLTELAQRLSRVLRHYNDNKGQATRSRRGSAGVMRIRALRRTAFYGRIPRLAEEIATWKMMRVPQKHRDSPDLLSLPSNFGGSLQASPLLRTDASQAAHDCETPPRARWTVIMSDIDLHGIALENQADENAFHAHIAHHWTAYVPVSPSSQNARTTPPHSATRARSVPGLPNMEEMIRAVLPTTHAAATAMAGLFTLSLKGTRVTRFPAAHAVLMPSCTVLYPSQSLKLLQMKNLAVRIPATVPTVSSEEGCAGARCSHPAQSAAHVSPPPPPPCPPGATGNAWCGEPDDDVDPSELTVRVESLCFEPRVAALDVLLSLYVETPTRAVAAAAVTWHRAYTVRPVDSSVWVLRRSPSAASVSAAAAGGEAAEPVPTQDPLGASSASLVLLECVASGATASDAPLPKHTPRGVVPPTRGGGAGGDAGHESTGVYGPESLYIQDVVEPVWHVSDDLLLSRSGLVLCFSNAMTNHLVVNLGGHAITVDPAVMRPGRPVAERLLMVVDAHMTVSFENGSFRLPAAAWTARLREAVADAEGGGVATALVPFVALHEGSYITCGESVRITFFSDDAASSSTSDEEEGEEYSAQGPLTDRVVDRADTSLARPARSRRKDWWDRVRPGTAAGEETQLREPYTWRASDDFHAPRSHTSVDHSVAAATAKPASATVVRSFRFSIATLQITQQDQMTTRRLRTAMRLHGAGCLRGGQFVRHSVCAEDLLVEMFAGDALSRATYTTILAPTALSAVSTDGVHTAVSVDALVMDVSRADVVHLAGIARACGELVQHVQHLSMTEAETLFSQRVANALAWRRLSPAAMANAWVGGEGDATAAGESGTDVPDTRHGKRGERETPLGLASQDGALDDLRQDSVTWRQQSVASVSPVNAAPALKSSLVVFVSLAELTVSDPRYPLLRMRAHGLLLRRVVSSEHTDTLHVQNADLGLEVYGKGRWDTVLLPTAALRCSRTSTVARHSSNVHSSVHAEGLQVRLSHMVLFKLRFAMAHMVLLAKSCRTALAASGADGTGAEPPDQDTDVEDESVGTLRSMADAVARVESPTSALDSARSAVHNGHHDASVADSARGNSHDSDDSGECSHDSDDEEREDNDDSNNNDDDAFGKSSASFPPSSTGLSAGSLPSTATHRFHNAYNCPLFLLISTDGRAPTTMPPTDSHTSRATTQASATSNPSMVAESSSRSRQQIDMEVQASAVSRASRVTRASGATETSIRSTRKGVHDVGAVDDDDEGRLLLIQPGCSVDVLIPYKRVKDLFVSLLLVDYVQWSRTRQRYELNALGRALDLTRTRVSASELQYGNATGLLVNDVLVVLSCADEHGGDGGWDGDELTAESHTIPAQWSTAAAVATVSSEDEGGRRRQGLVSHALDDATVDNAASQSTAPREAAPAVSESLTGLPRGHTGTNAAVSSPTAENFSAAQALRFKAGGHADNSANTEMSDVGGLLLIRIHAKQAIRNETGIPVLIRVCNDGDSEPADHASGDENLLSVRETTTTTTTVRSVSGDGNDTDNNGSRRSLGSRQCSTGEPAAAPEQTGRAGLVVVASGQQLPLTTRCARVVVRVELESSHSGRRIAYEATIHTRRAQSGAFVQLQPVPDNSPVTSSSPTSTTVHDEATVGSRDDQGFDTRPLSFFVVTKRVAESLSNFIYLYPRATVINHLGVPISVGLWQHDARAGPQTATDAALLEPWLPPAALAAHNLNEKQRSYRQLITLASHRHVPHRAAIPIFQCDYTAGLHMAMSFSQCTGDLIRTEDVVEVVTALDVAVEHHPRLLPLLDANGHTFHVQVTVLHRTIVLSVALWVHNYTEYPLLMTDSIVTRTLCAGQNRDTGIVPSQGVPYLLGVRLQDFTQVFLKVGLDARWSGAVAMDVGSKGVFESVQSTIGFTRSCTYAVQLPNAREGRPMTLVITPRWIIVNRTNKKLRLWFDCPGLTKAIKTSSRLQVKLEKRQAQRAAAAAAKEPGQASTSAHADSAAEAAWKETFGALSSATSVLLGPGEHHVSCIGTVAGNTLTLREDLTGMVPTVTSITDYAVQHKDLSKFYECQRTDPVAIDAPGQATFNLWAAPRPYLKRLAVQYGAALTVYRPPDTFSATAIEAYDPFLADAVVTGRVAVSVQSVENVLAVVVQPVRTTQIRVQNRCLHNVVMVRQQGSRRRNVIQPCRNHFFMWEDSKGERVLRLHVIGHKGVWFEVDLSKGDCHVTRCTTLHQGHEDEYYRPSATRTSAADDDVDEDVEVGGRGRVCRNGTDGHLPFHVRGFTSADQSGATVLITDAHAPLLNASDLWRASRMQTVFLAYLSVAWMAEGGAGAVLPASVNSATSTAHPSATVSRAVLMQTIIIEGAQLEWLSTDDVNGVDLAVHQIQVVDEMAQEVFFYRARLALPPQPTDQPATAAAVAPPQPSGVAVEASATAAATATHPASQDVGTHHYSTRGAGHRRLDGHSGLATHAGSPRAHSPRHGRGWSQRSPPGTSTATGVPSAIAPVSAAWATATQQVASTARQAVSSAWSLLKGSAVDESMALGEAHDLEVHVQFTQYADGMVRLTELTASLTPFVLVLSDSWVAQVLLEVRRTRAVMSPAVRALRGGARARPQSRQPPTPVVSGGGTQGGLPMPTTLNGSFHSPTANGSLIAVPAHVMAVSPTALNGSFGSVSSPLAATEAPHNSNNSNNNNSVSGGASTSRAFPASSPGVPNARALPVTTATVMPDVTFTTQIQFVNHVVSDIIDGQAGVAALAVAVAAGGGVGPTSQSVDDGGTRANHQRRRLRARFTTSVQTQKGIRTTGRRGREEDGGREGSAGGARAKGGTVQTYFRVEEMFLSQVSIFITFRRHHPDPLRPLLGVYTLMLPSSLHQRAFHLRSFTLKNSVETTASLRSHLAQWAIHSLRKQWTKATKIGALIDMFAWGRRNLPLRRPPRALTLEREQYLRSRQRRRGGDFPFVSSSSSSSSSSRSSSLSTEAGERSRGGEVGASQRKDSSAYRDKLHRIAQHGRQRGARRSTSGVVIVNEED